MKAKILIVEDNRALAMALAAKAANLGFATQTTPTLKLAKKALVEQHPDVVLFDLGLPDGSGMELLKEDLPAAAIITAHGELDHAIAAKKAGVNEFFVKPVDFDALEQFLRSVVPGDRKEPVDRDVSGDFIGEAASMRPVFQKIALACASCRPVLISGSQGSGRSHVANLIYRKSENPGELVMVDCREVDALPGEAMDGKKSTVVMDHVESLALDQQVALAKIFEEAESKMRVIAICGRRGLLPAVKDHRFHPELYYYLQGIEISLPDLSERKEDIPGLCEKFLDEVSSDHALTLSRKALEVFGEIDWPGNVRELREVLHRVGRTAEKSTLDVADFPESLMAQAKGESTKDPLSLEIRNWVDDALATSDEIPEYRDLLAGVESRLLEDLLSRFDGKPSVMAQELKLNRSTLRKRLRELGLG